MVTVAAALADLAAHVAHCQGVLDSQTVVSVGGHNDPDMRMYAEEVRSVAAALVVLTALVAKVDEIVGYLQVIDLPPPPGAPGVLV